MTYVTPGSRQIQKKREGSAKTLSTNTRLGLMSALVEYSKLDVAKLQLERAIFLLLDEKDYVSSITLAGASDEILGNLLRARGVLSSYDHLKIGFEKVFRLIHSCPPSESAFNALANGVRNGLKHYQDGAPMRFDPESVAADVLDRAVSNLWDLTQEETGNMERFKNYHMRRGRIINEVHLTTLGRIVRAGRKVRKGVRTAINAAEMVTPAGASSRRQGRVFVGSGGGCR